MGLFSFSDILKKLQAQNPSLKKRIEEASAKIRTGGPLDDEEDSALPVWAGVIPMSLTPGEPVVDRDVSVDAPEYVREYRR